MALEIVMAYSFVDATMRADTALMAAATGGVWQGDADIGTNPPFAAYSRQSDIDITTVNGIRIYAYILLQIKAVGPVSGFAALVTIANRIDALFGNVRSVGLPGGGGVLSSVREGQVEQPEVVNGAQWSNLGGLYRISLQGS